MLLLPQGNRAGATEAPSLLSCLPGGGRALQFGLVGRREADSWRDAFLPGVRLSPALRGSAWWGVRASGVLRAVPMRCPPCSVGARRERKRSGEHGLSGVRSPSGERQEIPSSRKGERGCKRGSERRVGVCGWKSL